MTTTEIKCIFIANKWNASSDIDYAAIADYWKVVRSHLTKRKQLSTRHYVRRSSPLENAIGAWGPCLLRLDYLFMLLRQSNPPHTYRHYVKDPTQCPLDEAIEIAPTSQKGISY